MCIGWDGNAGGGKHDIGRSRGRENLPVSEVGSYFWLLAYVPDCTGYRVRLDWRRCVARVAEERWEGKRMGGFACLLASCRRLLREGIGEEKPGLLKVVVSTVVLHERTGPAILTLTLRSFTRSHVRSGRQPVASCELRAAGTRGASRRRLFSRVVPRFCWLDVCTCTLHVPEP
jgi:hypothetical protein